ncbi:MAG: hypothetical protein ACI9JK_000907 [Phycisphaerales bacterium]|jgi:hypothetical protein
MVPHNQGWWYVERTKKQDKQLDLIQRLEKELKSSEAKPALSVFVLPKEIGPIGGIIDMVNDN